MVDVKTHMCFPTNIHEIKMNISNIERIGIKDNSKWVIYVFIYKYF